MVILLCPLCWTNCFLYANLTVLDWDDTSFDFEFGGEVVEVPIEGVGEGSTESDSSETGLDSDEWELEEGDEE